MKFHNHLNSWQVTTGCLQLAAVQLLCCVWFFVTPWTAATPVFPVLHYLPEPAQTHVQWVGDEIQPSRPLSFPSPPALNLSQHQGLFQWFGSSHQVAKYWNFSISPSNEYSGLISFRIDWLDFLAVQGTLKSLLQYHSSKVWIHWHSAIFMVQLSHPYVTTGKIIALIWWTFVSKVISLLYNMLPRFAIAFLSRSKCLLISWLQSLSARILEPQKIKSVTVSIVSPSICHEVMGLDAMIFVFRMLSFKPAFSLSSFTFIKRLFSSSSLSAIRVVSSAYLRLLIFLPAILIPACASSNLGFHLMYSAFTLNRVTTTALTYFFPNLEQVCCSMSGSNCCFLACSQVSQEVNKMIWYSHLFKNFQFVVIHTVKDFNVVNEAEVDVYFLEFSCFFSMIQQMLAIWSTVPPPLLNPAWTSESSWFMYCWSLTWRI